LAIPGAVGALGAGLADRDGGRRGVGAQRAKDAGLDGGDALRLRWRVKHKTNKTFKNSKTWVGV